MAMSKGFKVQLGMRESRGSSNSNTKRELKTMKLQ